MAWSTHFNQPRGISENARGPATVEAHAAVADSKGTGRPKGHLGSASKGNMRQQLQSRSVSSTAPVGHSSPPPPVHKGSVFLQPAAKVKIAAPSKPVSSWEASVGDEHGQEEQTVKAEEVNEEQTRPKRQHASAFSSLQASRKEAADPSARSPATFLGSTPVLATDSSATSEHDSKAEEADIRPRKRIRLMHFPSSWKASSGDVLDKVVDLMHEFGQVEQYCWVGQDDDSAIFVDYAEELGAYAAMRTLDGADSEVLAEMLQDSHLASMLEAETLSAEFFLGEEKEEGAFPDDGKAEMSEGGGTEDFEQDDEEKNQIQSSSLRGSASAKGKADIPGKGGVKDSKQSHKDCGPTHGKGKPGLSGKGGTKDSKQSRDDGSPSSAKGKAEFSGKGGAKDAKQTQEDSGPSSAKGKAEFSGKGGVKDSKQSQENSGTSSAKGKAGLSGKGSAKDAKQSQEHSGPISAKGEGGLSGKGGVRDSEQSQEYSGSSSAKGKAEFSGKRGVKDSKQTHADSSPSFVKGKRKNSDEADENNSAKMARSGSKGKHKGSAPISEGTVDEPKTSSSKGKQNGKSKANSNTIPTADHCDVTKDSERQHEAENKRKEEELEQRAIRAENLLKELVQQLKPGTAAAAEIVQQVQNGVDSTEILKQLRHESAEPDLAKKPTHQLKHGHADGEAISQLPSDSTAAESGMQIKSDEDWSNTQTEKDWSQEEDWSQKREWSQKENWYQKEGWSQKEEWSQKGDDQKQGKQDWSQKEEAQADDQGSWSGGAGKQGWSQKEQAQADDQGSWSGSEGKDPTTWPQQAAEYEGWGWPDAASWGDQSWAKQAESDNAAQMAEDEGSRVNNTWKEAEEWKESAVNAEKQESAAAAEEEEKGDGKTGEEDEDADSLLRPCILAQGFPASWERQHIEELFKDFGGVSAINFVEDAIGRAARVEFKEPERMEWAVEMLNDKQIDQKGNYPEACTLQCELFGQKEEEEEQKIEGTMQRIIFIDELSMPARPDIPPRKQDREVFLTMVPVAIATNQDLCNWLSAFGETEDIFILREDSSQKPKGKAYVRFKNHESAMACVNAKTTSAENGGVNAVWSESERAILRNTSVYHTDLHRSFTDRNGIVLAHVLTRAKFSREQLLVYSGCQRPRDSAASPISAKQLHFVMNCDSEELQRLQEVLCSILRSFHERVKEQLRRLPVKPSAPSPPLQAPTPAKRPGISKPTQPSTPPPEALRLKAAPRNVRSASGDNPESRGSPEAATPAVDSGGTTEADKKFGGCASDGSTSASAADASAVSQEDSDPYGLEAGIYECETMMWEADELENSGKTSEATPKFQEGFKRFLAVVRKCCPSMSDKDALIKKLEAALENAEQLRVRLDKAGITVPMVVNKAFKGPDSNTSTNRSSGSDAAAASPVPPASRAASAEPILPSRGAAKPPAAKPPAVRPLNVRHLPKAVSKASYSGR